MRIGEALLIAPQWLFPVLQRSSTTQRFAPGYQRKAREQQNNDKSSSGRAQFISQTRQAGRCIASNHQKFRRGLETKAQRQGADTQRGRDRRGDLGGHVFNRFGEPACKSVGAADFHQTSKIARICFGRRIRFNPDQLPFQVNKKPTIDVSKIIHGEIYYGDSARPGEGFALYRVLF